MRWLGALVLLLSGLGFAWDWFYWADEAPYLTPDWVDFVPTAEEQACAAIENPVPGRGVLRVDLSALSRACLGPPIVVWGKSRGKPVYAILLTVKLWGYGTSTDPDTGLEALIQTIERRYNYRLYAFGNRNRVDAEFRAPFITPPVDTPPAFTSGWVRWRRRQDLPLERPEVTDLVQYGEGNTSPYCSALFEEAQTCWTARLSWALPVRLVLQGGESGRYRIRVWPGLFREKATAAPLEVREGRLTRKLPRLVPAGERR